MYAISLILSTGKNIQIPLAYVYIVSFGLLNLSFSEE